MRTFLPGVLAVLAALGAGAPARAADTLYDVRISDRALDTAGPSALVHHGLVYVDVVPWTRTFDGLLTLKRDGTILVSIRGKSARFALGSDRETVNNVQSTIAGKPFALNGRTYVPLTAMADLAGAKYTVLAAQHRVELDSASLDH